MSYRVTHRTEYRYESEVTSSYGLVHLLPRDLNGQVTSSSQLTIVPEPDDAREHTDFFGNRVLHFAILRPHLELSVTAESVVDVSGRQQTLPLLAEEPWEMARDALVDSVVPEDLEARQFVLDSPQVTITPRIAAYAAPSFPEGRPLLDAVAHLMGRIHEDFEFSPGVTTVTTTADTLLDERAGVCQDFAHLMIGCLRSLGLAARYVSGYLETRPPPGKAKLVGADVSHAWTSVFVPGQGWLDLDPTNDQLVGDRYVTVGWGRDYTDVPPLKGVIFTAGESNKLRVQVDVVPVD